MCSVVVVPAVVVCYLDVAVGVWWARYEVAGALYICGFVFCLVWDM